MFEFLTAAEWELLRNWLGTVGGVIALLIAASTYRRNVKIKREEQARLVYSKVTHIEHHEPGALFDLLPNGARIGNGTPGVQIVTNPDPDAEHKAKGLAIAPLIQAAAVIHNGSKELIGPAHIQMVNTGRKRTWDEFSISVGVIDPESVRISAHQVHQSWLVRTGPASVPACWLWSSVGSPQAQDKE